MPPTNRYLVLEDVMRGIDSTPTNRRQRQVRSETEFSVESATCDNKLRGGLNGALTMFASLTIEQADDIAKFRSTLGYLVSSILV